LDINDMSLARDLRGSACGKTDQPLNDWLLNKITESDVFLAHQELVYYITTTPMFTYTKQATS